MQVTIPVPHPGAKINQDILNKLTTRGVFSGQRVFASLVEYMAPVGGQPQNTIPQDAAKPKYFYSFAPVGVFIDGSLSLDGIYASAFSDDSFSIYSKTLADFYRDRVRAKDLEFATIPRLVIRELPDYDKLNFLADVRYAAAAVAAGRKREEVEAELRAGRVVSADEQPWMFGSLLYDPTGPIERGGVRYRAMFPSNHGLKYENGLPVVFNYQEYDRAYPIKTTVYVGEGAAKGTAAIKAGVNPRATLFPAMMSPDDAALNAAILSLVEVK